MALSLPPSKPSRAPAPRAVEAHGTAARRQVAASPSRPAGSSRVRRPRPQPSPAAQARAPPQTSTLLEPKVLPRGQGKPVTRVPEGAWTPGRMGRSARRRGRAGPQGQAGVRVWGAWGEPTWSLTSPPGPPENRRRPAVCSPPRPGPVTRAARCHPSRQSNGRRAPDTPMGTADAARRDRAKPAPRGDPCRDPRRGTELSTVLNQPTAVPAGPPPPRTTSSASSSGRD